MARPDALALRWLVIGYDVPSCPNDSCAALFEPIVRTDPSALTWHVASSLFTLLQCGVLTAPFLSETLHQWEATGIAVEGWCRDHESDRDPYVRFMAAHALRVL